MKIIGEWTGSLYINNTKNCINTYIEDELFEIEFTHVDSENQIFALIREEEQGTALRPAGILSEEKYVGQGKWNPLNSEFQISYQSSQRDGRGGTVELTGILDEKTMQIQGNYCSCLHSSQSSDKLNGAWLEMRFKLTPNK